MGKAKTIKISSAAHQVAKKRAQASGIKLYRFIEMAIRAFEPDVSLVPCPGPPETEKAG